MPAEVASVKSIFQTARVCREFRARAGTSAAQTTRMISLLISFALLFTGTLVLLGGVLLATTQIVIDATLGIAPRA